MGCASDKSIIGWLCSLKVLEARKRFDSSAMGEEDGHISSGMNEGNLSLLFFPQLNKNHTVRRMSDPAPKGSCCGGNLKHARPVASVIDSLLCTTACSQSEFVPMILYNAKGLSSIRPSSNAQSRFDSLVRIGRIPTPSRINALGRHLSTSQDRGGPVA